MPKSIEDILIYIHDRPGEVENTKLGRIAREVDVHLVTFGRNTTPERLRLAKAFKDNNLGTRLGDRIVDLIHVPSRPGEICPANRKAQYRARRISIRSFSGSRVSHWTS